MKTPLRIVTVGVLGSFYLLTIVVHGYQPLQPIIPFPTVPLSWSSSISPYQLLVNRYPSEEPSLALGIDAMNPVFEWAVPSIIEIQLSIRLTVSRKANAIPVWDSGYVNTTVSSFVYGGSPLEAATRYVWTIELIGFTNEIAFDTNKSQLRRVAWDPYRHTYRSLATTVTSPSSTSNLLSTTATGEFVTGLYGSTLNPSTSPLWASNGTTAYPMYVFLRCETSLIENASTIVSAVAFVTALPTISISQDEIDNSKLLGAYKLWINNYLEGIGPGKSSRCGPLCPVQHAPGNCTCTPEHLYDVRDVTSTVVSLSSTSNTVTIALAGFNYPPVPELYLDSRMMFEMVIEYASGNRQIIGTTTSTADYQWYAYDATRYMNPNGNFGMSAWYYSPRENFDARLEPVGWKESGYNYSSSSILNWTTPVPLAPFPYPLVARPTPAVVITDDPTIVASPSKILYYNDSNRIFVDFGIDFTGGVCIDVFNNTFDGLSLFMALAEEVDYTGEGMNLTLWTRPMRTGNNYTQTWILRADPGKQTICMHEYGQFRYVQFTVVEGTDRPSFYLSSVTLNVRAWVVYYPASYVPVDSFQFPSNDNYGLTNNSSDTVALQGVWELCHYTRMAQSMDMYYDHVRQRDVYCVEELTIDTLQQFSLSNDFLAPPFSLAYVINNRPVNLGWAEWPVLEIISVYEIFTYTGDLTLFTNNYEQLRNFTLLSLIDTTNRTNGTGLWTCNFSAPVFDCNNAEVDWPPSSRDGFVFTPTNTVVNSIVYRGMLMFAEMANAIGGHTDDVLLFTTTANNLRTAINTLLWSNTSNGYVDGLTTTHRAFHSSVFALGMGVPFEDMVEEVVYNGVVNRLPVMNNSVTVCFPSNVWPSQWVLEGLYDYYDEDHGSLAYTILTCDLPQGWVQMLANNFTQTPEAWNNEVKGNEELGMTWGAAPGDIIPRSMLGVRPLVPGFEQILVKPQIGSTLTGIQGTVPSLKGLITVIYNQVTVTNSSKRNGMSIVETNLSLRIPGNTMAKVCLAMDACRTSNFLITVEGVPNPLSYVERDYVCVNITSGGLLSPRRLQCP